MQTLNTQLLSASLQEETIQLLAFIRRLPAENLQMLTQQPAGGGWSIAQILEHLNTYCSYYFPLLDKALAQSGTSTTSQFRPGWIGDYFTRMIQPAPDGVPQKKLKAAKKHLPAALPNASATLQSFISYQEQLLVLLQQAANKDLHAIKIPVSILPLLKLKTGDILRFLCGHQQRHLKQMQAVLTEIYQPSITYS